MSEGRAEGRPAEQRVSLGALAALFLRLGFVAFGGPASHIAMMRTEVVERRRWLTEAEFLDLLGAANLLPGPTSTETALFVGHAKRGLAGLAVAGVCFIVPAALIVTGLAWAYVRYGRLPAVGGVLYGVKPVVIAVVAQAIVGLARTALKSHEGIWAPLILGGAALAAAFAGLNPVAVLFGAGLILAMARWLGPKWREGVRAMAAIAGACATLTALPIWLATQQGHSHAARAVRADVAGIFLYFLKVGSVLFGSGYVLLAFLRDDLISRMHWLTSGQLLDAIAVGQVTPGPVFTTATFIGYVLKGPAGAAAATVGIFLPAFPLVGITGRYLAQLRHSPVASAFLDGVNIAAVALMAVVIVQLGRAALVDWITIGLALASGIGLFGFKVNSAWLVLAGAAIGLAARWSTS